jgi:hypothetical protein
MKRPAAIKRSTRKLVLHRETLRSLTGALLAHARRVDPDEPPIETYHPTCKSGGSCPDAGCVDPITILTGTVTVTMAEPKK